MTAHFEVRGLAAGYGRGDIVEDMRLSVDLAPRVAAWMMRRHR